MVAKYSIEQQTVIEGYDRKTSWFQPRVGWIAPRTAILTMNRNHLWGSDIFSAIHTMRSDDGGITWSDPVEQRNLDRRRLTDGYEVCPCDMTPLWHAASGTLLATGHTAVYKPGAKGVLSTDNTQQHWVTHRDSLFLSYTRRGADNDEVIRHRAPLFIAQVDPDRLCILRSTERILVPNRGAQLGNFGVVKIGPDESWVVTSECMLGDAKNPCDLALTESRGANNRVIIARIRDA